MSQRLPFDSHIDRLHVVASLLFWRQFYSFGIVLRENNADEGPARAVVARMDRDRQERRNAFDIIAQPLKHLGKVLSQVNSLLGERFLHVRQNHLAGLLREPLGDIERQNQNICAVFLRPERVGSVVGREQRPVGRDGLAELQLRASRHQLALPLDRRRARAGRLRHHANGHVDQHLAVGLVLGAEPKQLAVELRAHFARQQVRPSDIGNFAQELKTLLDEQVRVLGTSEKQPNDSAAMREEAAPS